MKKIFTIIAAWGIISTAAGANAQTTATYSEEMKALGAVSGQGLACGSDKYETFEMLARAILVTKARSNNQQAQGMQTYNEAKADAYMSKQMDGFNGCAEINRRFDRQDIFNTTLYADGTIKMPDGKIFTPRTPYDATMLFKANPKERSQAQTIYDKGKNVKSGEVTIRTEGSPAPIKTTPPSAATIGHIKKK